MLGEWFPSGIVSNPANGQVLADTGVLAAGVYAFVIIISASVAAVVDIEHRDAANATTLAVQRMYVPASTSIEGIEIEDAFVNNERIRLTNGTVIVGTVSASIVVHQLSSG